MTRQQLNEMRDKIIDEFDKLDPDSVILDDAADIVSLIIDGTEEDTNAPAST